MAKKRETGASASILIALQKHGYFRKISDRVQVGIPDIIGSNRGNFVGIEVKAIGEVPEDGWVPKKGSHPFDQVQVHNLRDIHRDGGLGVGIIVCGRQAVWCYWDQINELGRVDWNQCVEENQYIENIKDLTKFLEIA